MSDIKNTEIIVYVLNVLKQTTVRRCIRLLYLADKTSLEKWGRFIGTPEYQAVSHGVEHDGVNRLVKYANLHQHFSVQNNILTPLRLADTDELSESDIECLDQVLSLYRNYPDWHLRRLVQDRAWEKVTKIAGNSIVDLSKRVMITPQDIASEMDDAEDLIDYLNNLH